jgi:hypothetical protein
VIFSYNSGRRNFIKLWGEEEKIQHPYLNRDRPRQGNPVHVGELATSSPISAERALQPFVPGGLYTRLRIGRSFTVGGASTAGAVAL